LWYRYLKNKELNNLVSNMGILYMGDNSSIIPTVEHHRSKLKVSVVRLNGTIIAHK